MNKETKQNVLATLEDNLWKILRFFRLLFWFSFWTGGFLSAIGILLFRLVDVETMSLAIFSGMAYLLLGELEKRGG